MSDIEFVNGLVAKPPNDNAPEYVKAKLWIKRQELIAWLQAQSGDSINADIKESQGGKWYIAVDNWKPNAGNGTQRQAAPQPDRAATQEFKPDDIPF